VDVGTLVKSIREHSPHRDLRSFAQQAGISYEGLRKIEIGERIPSAKTLEQIIQAVEITNGQARQMRILRDLDHAKREHLVNKGVTDEKISGMAITCQTAVVDFLDEFEMALSEEDQEDLLERIQGGLERELRD
jgi:transcriptional regulator with XRE-family HTH domain